mmetsp:Transcript_61864/g.114851  ORF Transcript_61864/g.114851 Transcript_61864/m.114851 type:complete len:180 (+) Transcript_61864:80-619(+)
MASSLGGACACACSMPHHSRFSAQKRHSTCVRLGLLAAIACACTVLQQCFIAGHSPSVPARRTIMSASPEGDRAASSDSMETLRGPDGKEPEWYKAVREGKIRQTEEELAALRALEFKDNQRKKFKAELDGAWWFRNTFFIQIPALIFIVCVLLLTFADQLGLDPQTRMMIKATTGLIN